MIKNKIPARKLENELLIVEVLATATLEKRETGLGTSARVVRIIPRRAGSISSLHGGKTNLKQKKTLFATSKEKSPIRNGRRAIKKNQAGMDNGHIILYIHIVGSIPYMCTPPEFYSCQILSDFVRCCQILLPSKSVVRAIEVSHATQLANTRYVNMSFDKILDLTAVVFKIF